MQATLNGHSGSRKLRPRVVHEELGRAPWLMSDVEKLPLDSLFERTIRWLMRASGLPEIGPIGEIKITCDVGEPKILVEERGPRVMTAAERLIERVNRLGTPAEGTKAGTDDGRTAFERGLDGERDLIAQETHRPVASILLSETMRGWRQRDPRGYAEAEEQHRRQFVAGLRSLDEDLPGGAITT